MWDCDGEGSITLAMSVRIELIHDLEAVSRVQSEWNALREAADVSPYASFEWWSTALLHFSRGAPLIVVLAWDDHRLAGVVPLELTTEKVARTRQPVLRFAGGWLPRAPALISPQADAAVVAEALLEALRCQRDRWLYCRMARVPSDSPLLGPRSPVAGPAGVRRAVTWVGDSVIIDIPHSWDAYRQTLSSPQRKSLSRHTNGLRRSGPLRLIRLGLTTPPPPADLDALLDDALLVSRLSWQGGAGDGRAISDDDTVAFFRDVSHRLAALGMLDLSVLYAGDRPVSFVWGAASWPRSTISKLGFDPDLSRHSPGVVHLGQLVADSIDRGVREIDFGHEFADYKLKWGRRRLPLYDVLYYPPRPLSRLVFWWRHDRDRDSSISLDSRPGIALDERPQGGT